MLSYATDRPVKADEMTRAQKITVRNLIGWHDVEVVKTTVARGLPEMPADVFTIRIDGDERYLHPSGDIAFYYMPAIR